MSTKSIHPPWEYLEQATVPALQSFELSRLNHAANLKKEIDNLLDQWLDETAAALLARFLMDRPVVHNPPVARTAVKQFNAAPAEGQMRALNRSRAR